VKAVFNDLMLILHQDSVSLRTLRAVAERLGCEWVEAETREALDEVLAIRHPTIALLAVDRAEHDGMLMLQTLAHSSSPPATLLIGSADGRLLSSITRAAEGRSLKVIGVTKEPLDALELERTLAPYLHRPPPIPREELLQALREHQLMVQYQPKVSLSPDGLRIGGAEALVRWLHPRKGLLQPRYFLEAVEEHELMTELTDFVLTEALRQAGHWRKAGLHLQVVVNLSLRLVRDREFPDRLVHLLGENEIPAQDLVLDVTEASAAVDHGLMMDVFTRLRILGVGISLDNFGTGRSSLTELYQMPYSEIKVDHSLMADVTREPDAMLIVQAIVDLAHTLKLNACAEGIENRQTLEFARSAGFDTAQGQFFSGPVPAAELEQIVRAWPSFGPAATGRWRAIAPQGIGLDNAAPRPLRPGRTDRGSSI
jgi:EAL domain-containing protein (putative c-di-GMP-specific phosphodiesterase class I)